MRQRSRATAAALALLAVLSPAASRPTNAVTTYTGIVISDEGGLRSLPATVLVDEDPGAVDGTLSMFSEDGQAVVIRAGGYRIHLTSGPGPFQIGRVIDTQTHYSGYDPGMDVDQPTGCGRTQIGSFDIIELPEADGAGNLTRFAADLRWRCERTIEATEPPRWLHASIRVGAATAPALLHLPLDLAVGETNVGAYRDLGVSVPNVGRGSLTLGSLALSGPDASMFSIRDDGCSGQTFAGGASCQFTLRFAPTALLDRVTWLTIGAGTQGFDHVLRVTSRGRSPLLDLPTAMTLNGDPGHWVINGSIHQLAGGDVFVNDADVGDARYATVNFPDGWVTIGAPDPELLQPGRYEVAVFDGDPQPGISLSGFGRGCNWATGWFDVLEPPVYDETGTLLSVAFDFEHHCEGAEERVRGSVRFHSTLALIDLVPPVGTVDIGGGSFASSQIVSLAIPAVDDESDVSLVALSNDGLFWTTRPYAPTQTWTLSDGEGYKHVSVKWLDENGNWSLAESDTVYLDRGAPEGSVSIASGAVATKWATATVSTAATDAGSGLSQVALSNDGVTWTTRAYASSQPWTLAGANGIKSVRVKWKDQAGNWSPVKTDTIVLDTVAPTVTAPRRGLVAGTALANGAITTRIPWSGSDLGSGIARYELAQQTDGGAWTTVSTTLTSPTATRSLSTERTYRFRVRAVDRASNVGAWTYGDTFRVSRFSEGNSRITYSGTWSTSRSSAFWGGVARASSQAGARASITFTGRTIAWIASMGPTRGKADVLVNGVKVATVDLYSTTARHQQVVWVGTWSSAASRTVSIRVLGTSGRPRVDLDAFVTAN